MNKQRTAKIMAELAEDVHHMDEQAQEAFAMLLPMMAKLYRNDSKTKCVLLFSDDTHNTIMHINADQFEAYGMIVEAMPQHSALLMRDAPNPERLN